ncbi:MAG: L-serine ammonia-lyase, iron-sulfur-dependent, subunit alpha [Proteobacteria bacterium]|nr:L-serine ammonia-lyase, iron-sulfur-dependent, subunit alpha [Pseudomonadota bacterium]MBU2468251.1 L-serine ammonia-lyase, iron-sulfur-dependent, subunit alpha [Pseudomonadota bacterium]MBU2518179.1 L-serine ammonia-lyase, iron-sulfur-dependent, subunit alpha [Pseudomonadota bacterium]
MTYTIKDVLRLEVAPALGCTEPVAVALGAAAAAALLPGREIDSIEVSLDPNVYKNGLSVSIPGSNGLSGLDTAAVIGALAGNPSLGMEVLDPVDEDDIERVKGFLKDRRVKLMVTEPLGLRIETTVRSGSDEARSLISKLHDNIESLWLNGKPQENHPLLSAKSSDGSNCMADLEDWLRGLSLDQLLALVEGLDQDDLDFLRQGMTYNLRLAQYGLKHGSGLAVGRTLESIARQGLLKRDMALAARILTSAAADARMAGIKLPAMSSAGSGNHGLTAILPLCAVRDFIHCDEHTLLEAMAFSHVVTAYIKAYTGRLSAVCGCSVAAGAGATAGVTYMLGGQTKHIAGAVKILTGDLAGIICDGAKNGCAIKLATAANSAVQAALFSLHGLEVNLMQGIVGNTMRQTSENLGALSTQGMVETDRTILKIIMEKHFSPEE